MDFISIILASYLDIVSDNAYQQIVDQTGSELQTRIVNHQEQDIAFSYQLWKIKQDSVCEDKKQQMLDYSKCTKAAKSLFYTVCQHLQTNPKEHWQYQKLKNMYCSAALSYQPTTASISWSNEEDDLKNAKRKCSTATVASMRSSDRELIRAREEACTQYKKMLKEQSQD